MCVVSLNLSFYVHCQTFCFDILVDAFVVSFVHEGPFSFKFLGCNFFLSLNFKRIFVVIDLVLKAFCTIEFTAICL